MNFKISAIIAMLIASNVAHADLYPYVDNYQLNEGAGVIRNSRTLNPTMALLKGYDSYWTPGTSWNNGTLTAAGGHVLKASQAYVVNITNNSTAAQQEYAYLVDRRHQSYSAIDGLGNLAGAYRAASGAFTTITSVGPDALIGKYDEKGNGAGLQSSASVGKIVHLVNTMRGHGTSSNPSKETFNSPRPWRLNDDFQVVTSGNETVGYYTSTNADGTPNKTVAQRFLPDYDSNVKVLPTLLAVRSTSPASDGGFVSGHTNAAYLASFGMAYATPEKFEDLMFNASEMSDSRIVAGMHLPTDVIGGRMLATALATGILNAVESRDGSGTYMNMAQLKADARAQGQAFVAANTTAVTDRFAQYDADTSSAYKAKVALYTSRLTYGLPNTNPTGVAAVVPKGAEVLLETRLSYMSAAERREVLRTTAIDSGFALTDDDEGYGRLNLMKAAGGYGRFDSNVTVNMNAANGGFDARDVWKNDISGTGGLTKEGSGELVLTGNNTFTGDVNVNGGTFVGESANAFGAGNVNNNGGTVAINNRGTVTGGGDYTQAAGSTFAAYVATDTSYDIFSVRGNASLDGVVSVIFQNGYSKEGEITLISASNRTGQFDSFTYSGLTPGYTASISYNATGVTLTVTAVPEADTYAMLLAGLGLMGAMVRRRK